MEACDDRSGAFRGSGSPFCRVVGDRMQNGYSALMASLRGAKPLAAPRSPYEDSPSPQVKVLPLEPADFARPHPALHPQPEERFKVAICSPDRLQNGS